MGTECVSVYRATYSNALVRSRLYLCVALLPARRPQESVLTLSLPSGALHRRGAISSAAAASAGAPWLRRGGPATCHIHLFPDLSDLSGQ